VASFPVDGQPDRCTAKSRQTGNRCTKTVVKGRAVCRYHGGLGGRPIIHGRYSKAMGSLREAYEEAMNDPTLMELRDSLAVLDVVVQKAAARASEQDTPGFRRKAAALYREAQDSGDPQVMARKLAELGALLEKGTDGDAALKALGEAVERLAKRQEKAWDIRLSAANVINARDMVAMLSRFADIVIEESDKDVATRIISRIDGEIMGNGKTADRLATGGDPLGFAVRDVPRQADRIHEGGSGVESLEEAD